MPTARARTCSATTVTIQGRHRCYWYNANDDSPEADALLGLLFAEAARY